MELKGLIIIPSRFDDPEIKFDLSSFIVNMDDDSQMELDLVHLNCPSLSSMADVVSEYFTEVIRRQPTQQNILTATYLGMIDMLLRDYPNGFPIRQDILNIIHQEPEFRHIQSNTGYYYQFDMSDWNAAKKAVMVEMYTIR